MKKTAAFLMMLIIILQISVTVSAEEGSFDDVPKGHWAEPMINELRTLGITKGQGNNTYGLGQTISRAEFVTFLVRLMDWDAVMPQSGSYLDNKETAAWFYSSIETAVVKGVVDTDDRYFRPMDLITREEMAVMIVNTLGYGWLAELKSADKSPFRDVSSHVGHMTLLSDFGIVNGKGNGLFAPGDTAKREEAAAILMRMYNKRAAIIDEFNGFYAVSSYGQKDLLDMFDAISFGWANLGYSESKNQVVMFMDKPKGYEEPIEMAKSLGIERRLSIYGSNLKTLPDGRGLVDSLIASKSNGDDLVQEIITELTVNDDFGGVVIDFEELIGETSKANLNSFLETLSLQLKASNKSLTVMVHPNDYYSGYDFRTIGVLADHVILMAHDYNAKSLTEAERAMGYAWTPLTPIKDVYRALQSITDKTKGVEDIDKVSLQVSFATAQWGTDVDGYVVNAQPYLPAYDKLYARLIEPKTLIKYDLKSRSPYAEYKNATDGLNYRIWYEDSRSINEKLALAKMFDIRDVSVWRLGNIPDYSDAAGKSVYMNVMDSMK